MKFEKKIFVLILLIFAGATIYLIYAYQNRPQILPYIPSAQSILIDIKNELGVESAISEDQSSWKDRDSKLTPLRGFSFSIGAKYKPLTLQNINSLKKDLEAQFTSKKFEKEIENEYKKDEIYCVTSFKEDEDPYSKVFCGSLNHEASPSAKL